jgi:hypothetical protein
MTTPASAPRARARYATPGVVMMPAECTFAPFAQAPRTNAASIHSPDSRESRPITISACRFFLACSSDVSDAPMHSIADSTSGNSPACPLIPSVPKYLPILNRILPHRRARCRCCSPLFIGITRGTPWKICDCHIAGSCSLRRARGASSAGLSLSARFATMCLWCRRTYYTISGGNNHGRH